MGFHTYSCIGNYQEMDSGEMVLKVGEGHKVNCIHITAMGFQYHGEFRNEAWDEDVKI